VKVEECDQNGISVEERVNMCQARGVCLELLEWWNTKYTAHDAEAGSESLAGTVFTTHLLITQATALLKYKRCTQQDGREGAPGCTLLTLTRQIENVLSILPGEVPGAALQEWRRSISDEKDVKLGFSPKDWGHIKIMEREPPQIYRRHFSADNS